MANDAYSGSPDGSYYIARLRPTTGPYALKFPSNSSGSNQTDPYAVIQFANPQLNGLPIWGPSGQGVTYLLDITHHQQTGYYVGFWWANNGSFLWDGGSSNTYVGCHPYPTTGNNTGTAHNWEIATDTGGDFTNTLAGSPQLVVKETRRKQAARVTRNPDGTKTIRFYINLPSLANADIIEVTVPAGYGETNPPSPAVIFGDSPWYASFQHERASATYYGIKIIAKSMSETDIVSEAADFSQLVTADAIAHNWWSRAGFEPGHDANGSTIADSFGSGRSFSIINPSSDPLQRINLVAAS